MRAFLPDYDLLMPARLAEALDLLAQDDGWRPIAGGTDLMVLLNAGKLAYKKLVSIQQLPELQGIAVSDDCIEIGAAVTFAQIRQHERLTAEYPLLCEAASWTGGIANQNRGTIGGNLANASPAADSAPMLLVYDAELELISRTGTRSIPYRNFHTGYKQTALRPDELIRAVRLPRPSAWTRQYCRKVGARRAQAISKVCLAFCIRVQNQFVEDIRIALGSVAPVPLRCHDAEAALKRRSLDDTSIAEVVSVLEREIQPITDIRSTDLYRRDVSKNLLRQFLTELLPSSSNDAR